MKAELWAIGLMIFAGMIGAFGPIFLKKASHKMTLKDLSSIYKNHNLMISVAIYGLSTIIALPALRGGELSVLYPMVGLSYVWVCLYSKILLKEHMNLIKWMGIVLIVLGVASIGFGA